MMRTRIKICGLTRPGDVDAAVEAGADAIGLVLYRRSPRALSIEQAARLAARLPPFVTPVGLFVNASAAEVAAASAAIPSLVLQFHGDESPGDCRHAGRSYLRAARVTPDLDFAAFAAAHADAQALVLDADVEGYGGGGRVFDWSLIPASLPLPLILSGGLHAGNVGKAIARLQPFAVDVSSGVESAKGIKSPAAIRLFCAAVRAADEATRSGACRSAADATEERFDVGLPAA